METDLKAALAQLQKEVHNHPKHWPSLLGIASIQVRQGAPELALESLHAAMKAVPTKYRWLCHANLGRANLDANNVAATISELELAVRQMPSSASAHFFLAEVYRHAGREEDAGRADGSATRIWSAPTWTQTMWPPPFPNWSLPSARCPPAPAPTSSWRKSTAMKKWALALE